MVARSVTVSLEQFQGLEQCQGAANKTGCRSFRGPLGKRSRFEDGSVHVAGLPSRKIKLEKLAEEAESRKGGSGPVIATASNSIEDNAPAVAVHAVKVAVDLETGKVSPKNYIAVQDVGFAINPMLVEGQIQGGVLQGLGWGLWEENDARGQLLASNFLDYAMPGRDDSVFVDAVLVENPSLVHWEFVVRTTDCAGRSRRMPTLSERSLGCALSNCPFGPQALWKARNP